MRKLFLTFDTEDFISDNSIWVLKKILEGLKEHALEAIFFITGHMAERLQEFEDVVDLLNEHQIGFHSSSHSVHPTIFEFTDVESYEEAYKTSLCRETAHINPLSGEIEGKGGILALRASFPKKKIRSFRAPGHCWTPPHLEALRTLGVDLDFSASISRNNAVNFKGITFYPYPIMGQWTGSKLGYRNLLIALLSRKLSILTIHPSLLVNKTEWDAIYFGDNPNELTPPPARGLSETRHLLRTFDLLLNQISHLKRMHIIETTPTFESPNRDLSIGKFNLKKCYRRSMQWAIQQKYRPNYHMNHFRRFFELSPST